MNILFAISEAFPLYKIGGLGDVGGSLPDELIALGTDVKIAMPFHPEINCPQATCVTTFDVTYDNQRLPVSVYKTVLPGKNAEVFLFKEDLFLSQHTDASDNHADKYAVLSLVIAHFITQAKHIYATDIVHLNDWHTALVPLIARGVYEDSSTKYVITIHNLAYQGNTDTPVIHKLGIDTSKSPIYSWTYQDYQTNILLEGMLASDIITAVSPTYAQEILTPEYGAGIHEHLIPVKQKIHGVLNGLDYQVFNPETDKALTQNYNSSSLETGKSANKLALQKELDLQESDQKVMIGFVGRVDPGQKGVQLIIEMINNQKVLNEHTQFAFLGVGDPQLHEKLHQAAAGKNHIVIKTEYNEALASRIYAASDLVLIPSKYEPCGLVQMIAMAYGSLPIARSTGGLKDTITHDQNGFLFSEYSTFALEQAINHALEVIGDTKTRLSMFDKAIQTRFLWQEPARQYLKLYQQLQA